VAPVARRREQPAGGALVSIVLAEDMEEIAAQGGRGACHGEKVAGSEVGGYLPGYFPREAGEDVGASGGGRSGE